MLPPRDRAINCSSMKPECRPPPTAHCRRPVESATADFPFSIRRILIPAQADFQHLQRKDFRPRLIGALGSTRMNCRAGTRPPGRPSTSTVDALDDASYDEDFGQWHNLSGVNLSSESLRVVLSVFDEYGNSICQNTADLTTSCKFQTGFASTFTIRVDNTQNSSPANYSVCAF